MQSDDHRLAALNAAPSVDGELIVMAIEPVRHWYESDEHEPRPLHEILTDIVADLQSDRAECLALRAGPDAGMAAAAAVDAKQAARNFIASWPRHGFADYIEPALAEAFERFAKTLSPTKVEEATVERVARAIAGWTPNVTSWADIADNPKQGNSLQAIYHDKARAALSALPPQALDPAAIWKRAPDTTYAPPGLEYAAVDQNDVWLLRFADQDCGDMWFGGKGYTAAETRALAIEAWNKYAPAWSVRLMRTVTLDEVRALPLPDDLADRLDGEQK